MDAQEHHTTKRKVGARPTVAQSIFWEERSREPRHRGTSSRRLPSAHLGRVDDLGLLDLVGGMRISEPASMV